MGRLDVHQMLREMSAKQFREWEIYAELEPFSEKRADYRAASIVQMLANVNRSSKRSPYKLEDFVLKFDQESKETKPDKSWQEMKSSMMMWALAASVKEES